MDFKKYAILPISRIDEIDFSLFDEDSKDTVRKSIDGNLFVLTWVGNCPIKVDKKYTQEEILIELRGDNWHEEPIYGMA